MVKGKMKRLSNAIKKIAAIDLTDTSDKTEYYMTGGCGIFAIALHRIFGYYLGAYLDDECEDFCDEDEEPIPAVVHVFAHDGDKIIDAKGIRTIENVKSDFYDVDGRTDWDVTENEIKHEYCGDNSPLYEFSEADVKEAIDYIQHNVGKYKIHQ